MRVFELPSVTIFWEELGIQNGKLLVRQQNATMATYWEEEIAPWMERHVKHHWNPHEAGVWFADRHEALLFKLHWAGKFPEPR